jgi:hypothetical protein
MIRAYNLFNEIISSSKDSIAIYDYLVEQMRVPFDCSDILRWQWAQSVSAFDKLIHDLVRLGMIEICQRKRPATSKYNSFKLSLESINSVLDEESDITSTLEQSVFAQHGFLSFQDPSKVNDALSLFWDEQFKWQAISSYLGESEKVVRTQLKNIVIRRNQIVHEGDFSNDTYGRQVIEKQDAIYVVNFISELGTAVYNLVKL